MSRPERYTDNDGTFGLFREVNTGNKKPCRACMDFKSWMAQKHGTANMSESSGADHTNENADAASSSRKCDCPLDRDELGRNTWSLLHSIAAYYPDNPPEERRQGVDEFMRSLSVLYPCDYCAKDLKAELKRKPPQTASREALSKWMCDLHNSVNAKLGKQLFDCSLIDQRWKDGWADGRCD
ncbi:unnamed protein product [Soboliphyme baturini]|uniref:Sulfhydryl oxidase n=1 Tax=Soboliphyme baturini TaxID=241478 RepID=A0A183J554_9BILA|nr:unnamed protein product [Soboliphyme baturini]